MMMMRWRSFATLKSSAPGVPPTPHSLPPIPNAVISVRISLGQQLFGGLSTFKIAQWRIAWISVTALFGRAASGVTSTR
jgi:hypothetical protein